MSKAASALTCVLAFHIALAARDAVVIEQRVVTLNTESISKLDVEERMGGIAEKLYDFRAAKQESGTWNSAAAIS